MEIVFKSGVLRLLWVWMLIRGVFVGYPVRPPTFKRWFELNHLPSEHTQARLFTTPNTRRQLWGVFSHSGSWCPSCLSTPSNSESPSFHLPPLPSDPLVVIYFALHRGVEPHPPARPLKHQHLTRDGDLKTITFPSRILLQIVMAIFELTASF